MVLTRRNFITSIGLGLSAVIFTPKLIVPSWRNTIKPEVWKPRYAILNRDWLNEWVISPKPITRPKSDPLIEMICDKDYILLREPFYQDMYPVMRNDFGVIIPPLLEMPVGFDPKHVALT